MSKRNEANARGRLGRRASYRAGVYWIAWNDEPEHTDAEDISKSISVLLLSELFDVEPMRVANDVIRHRRTIKRRIGE